ncbi:MAG TPA: DUF4097 family beta strand repeat-containing protein [Bryobacteraceae bacterium]|jgi:DUF4097 and DUF4098 domain-containing protein YvlB|nr:DUF4097 family beta strand repeat-containing protein [Bryobacteraceae bacterium]
MHPKLVLPALAAGLLCLTACDFTDLGDMERFNRDFHYSHTLSPNGRLLVETFNGSVEISGWDQNTVDISGTKYGPSQQAADDLKVNIDNGPDSVSIRVLRPSERRNNQGARFVIKVPRSAVLDRIITSNGAIRTADGSGPARFRTSNGPIHVTGLRGPLDAQSSNGPVELLNLDGDVVAHTSNGRIHAEHLNGTLEATTSNSGIHADISRADRPVRVETSNGPVDLTLPDGFNRDARVSTNNSSITLHLPAVVNAHVVARTSNSSISTDFDVRMQGEFSKNHMDATIGSGGALLDLSTSNGNIRLLKM